MNTLLVQAIKKAGQIRTRLKLDMFEPVNIFDICHSFGIDVQFVSINMEGMYLDVEGMEKKRILLSNLRPFPRRIFTGAHELGHHLFGHGTKVDGLIEEGVTNPPYDSDEELVDGFAGAFLMPVAGIEAEFTKRKWNMKAATPIQFFTISSVFGVGYSTLVTHCKANRLITDIQGMTLLKQSPAKILQSVMGEKVNISHFKLLDEASSLNNVDLEVGNYLILPSSMTVEGTHLKLYKKTSCGNAFVTDHSGVTRAICPLTGKSFFIRIQNAGYIGFSEYRHLEDKIKML